MTKGVSVIVCCYNSSSRIERTLYHLANQVATIDWEVILVDNASTDDTSSIARHAWRATGRTDIPFSIVNEPIAGLTYARQKGVEAARYPTLVFCDDDNWLDETYISEAHRILSEHPSIGALGGIGIPQGEIQLPEWFDKYKFGYACYRQADCDGELTDPLATLFGAGMVVRKSALILLQRKEFEPFLSDRKGSALTAGGDTELCFALRMIGYKLWFSSRLTFRHYIPAARLTADYLYKLNKSLSYCSVFLIVYRYVLMGKRVDAFTWLKDIMYQIFLLGSAMIKLFLGRGMHLDRKLEFDFAFSSFKGFLNQRRKYRASYDKLLRLKN